MPPLPPPPPLTAALGSKKSFIALLIIFGFVAFGWQWRRAGPEDWAAGAAFLALLPAALTFGGRRGGWRKMMGAAGCAGSLACWSRQVLAGGASMPALEAAIAAGVGVCALLGSSFLGQWGQDRSEAIWARVLGPAAGLSLLISALTWSVPDTQIWTTALIIRAAEWRDAFAGSGGGWRWLGAAGVAAALGSAFHLKVRSSS